jgi:hypothetical protein
MCYTVPTTPDISVKMNIYPIQTQIAAFLSLSLRERAGERVFKKGKS